MKTDRRAFLGGLAAVTATGPSAFAAEAPLLKIGIITDTHVTADPASCRPVQAAWGLFRRERTDAVFNLGDIADLFNETAYRNYRAAVDAVLTDGAWRPETLYVWASHDAFGYRGDPDRTIPRGRHEAYAEAGKLLGSTNGEWAVREWKGYAFLVLPQFLESGEYAGRYEEMIRTACAAHPGKPVFLLDHIPPVGTVPNSDIAGDWRRGEVLKKYPQVVDLTGHVHGSLRNEALVWQGAYTVINFGCMADWGGGLVGATGMAGRTRSAGILEVYPGRLLVRRFHNVVDAPTCEETPWTIPWPFDPRTAPYSVVAQRRRPAPAFAPTDRLQFDPATLTVTFPEAASGGSVYLYRVRAQQLNAQGGWDEAQVRETYSQFAVDRTKRGLNRVMLDAACFAGGAKGHFTVTPIGFGRQEGVPLVLEAMLPSRPLDVVRTVCELKEPMRELDFRWESWCVPLPPDADGFLRTKYDDEIAFDLPTTAFPGPKGSVFRVIIDITVDVPDGRGYYIGLCRPAPKHWFVRTKTVSGSGARMRLVARCEKRSDTELVRGWFSLCPGRIRIDRVRVEELNV